MTWMNEYVILSNRTSVQRPLESWESFSWAGNGSGQQPVDKCGRRSADSEPSVERSEEI
jgi:hypothetical protein